MEAVAFEQVKKSAIVSNSGVKYNEFRAGLKPKYGLVWTHIILGYVALLSVLGGCFAMQHLAPKYWWLTIPAGSLLVGYIIAYIHLFIHEAAHYNIAADRKKNDKLANIFIGFIVGMDIGFYRLIHFDHHRHLGTVNDTERTYFDALNLRFILESLTGIRVLKVMMNREEKAKQNANLSPEVQQNNRKMFLGGAAFNFLLAVTLALTGNIQVAAVWVIGLGIIFPFFASLRQLLEHRGDEASASVNYAEVAHGSTNRMFGNGIIASTMGGAGFNRHLLHHWDPQISYTRLKDLEKYLLDTPYAAGLQKHHTKYARTFFKLFNK